MTEERSNYWISHKLVPRIRYGSESSDWGADQYPCHDCGATKGQYHTFGCDVERCPICGRQAIGCEHIKEYKISKERLSVVAIFGMTLEQARTIANIIWIS